MHEECEVGDSSAEGEKSVVLFFTAVRGKEIICTDSLSAEDLDDFKDCQVTRKVMSLANENAVLNPCPPFYRREEVSADAIESDYFVGYAFKKNLLVVQQAVMVWCMNNR